MAVRAAACGSPRLPAISGLTTAGCHIGSVVRGAEVTSAAPNLNPSWSSAAAAAVTAASTATAASVLALHRRRRRIPGNSSRQASTRQRDLEDCQGQPAGAAGSVEQSWESHHDSDRGATSAETGRRSLAVAGLATAVAQAALGAPAAQAEEAAVEDVAAAASVGVELSDLVFPKWFVGDWGCVGELFKVSAGVGGEEELAKQLPGTDNALRAARSVVGTDVAEIRAVRRWEATKLPPPGQAPSQGGGAVEDARGLSAGALAAGSALAGPAVRMRPVKSSGQEPAWEVKGPGGRLWKLRAAGAVAKPGDAGPKAAEGFRTFELFEVEAGPGDAKADSKTSPGPAAIRVATVWRKAPLKGNLSEQIGNIGIGKPDTARDFALQAVQVAFVLPAPKAAGEERSNQSLAEYTTQFLYGPVLPLGPA
mmetsp:Transcript_17670/g.38720  ORF Transcript_17670/g.38720 Transcript_17670/m.38720 type:complete len:423 (+) Transcript_17670:48-1316(+)|eukprot:CAMPEP_0170596054 /NCGR_PEP_ID=MMETSP0224-20130122/14900_1 /TAXON_ID=285029 /ORGANISM="Togula jolla, Strain CCCM 725" /LENGTH=422 /DNA_ID=CAMNT_0010920295 /DNA_START=47 /DNA_END=1315 /DNA_ORIENTATION=-